MILGTVNTGLTIYNVYANIVNAMNTNAVIPDAQQSELNKFKLFYEQIDDNTPVRRPKQRQAK